MGNELSDIRRCVNCGLVGKLTEHGRCSFCGSDAVCLPENSAVFQKMRDTDLWELEKMFCKKS